MDRTVEGYLAELKGHLAGADPALVQDALYDADEYLRSAIAEAADDPAAFDAAVEAYGTPDEVAAAYRDTERTVQAALRTPPRRVDDRPWWGRFFGIVADPVAWGALFYMLLALATGTAYFTLVVTGFSMSLGLSVLIIGVPFALLFLAVVRAVSFAEGRMVEGLLGTRMPRRPRGASVQGGIWERIKWWLTDYRTWTTMLYMLLQLPLGIIYFTSVVTSLALSVGLIAMPVLTEWQVPMFIVGDYAYVLERWGYPLVVAAGILGLFLTLWLAKGVGYLHGVYAKVMLVGPVDQTQSPVGPVSPAHSAPAGGSGQNGGAL